MLRYELGRMTDRELRSVPEREGVDLSRAMKLARPIVEGVRKGGDKALLRYAREFDSFKGTRLTVAPREVRSASKRIPGQLLTALALSARRIESFHRRQLLRPFEYSDEAGLLGQKVVPLRRVGVYVPGGTADYVSTVLMACVPARVAGVREIAMCTPGRGGAVPASILAAADLCGVREVHPAGGAQAIAAMAYGTESVRKVQKIVGPGGAVVSAAKMLVRNDCEIDFLAGPSEVLIIADSTADPELLASDMLAQLEHDTLARAVLVSDSDRIIAQTMAALEDQISCAERRNIVQVAARQGAIFVKVESIEQALELSNKYAPEHLLIVARKAKTLLRKVENAGSVFLGELSSVAFGDDCSGTNHILPTKGVAAMKSALSVYDFLKVMPYQSISPTGVARLAGAVDILARAEGLSAHADAAMMRKRKVGG